MDYTPTIIYDLAIILILAAGISFIFHQLKLPLIIGYLIGGLLLGPNIFYKSLISNEKIIKELSELGVVFLMFYIGLEFNLNKLNKVVKSVSISVIMQTISMIFLGILIAPILGWSNIDGLFLGCLLAIGSTMVTFGILGKKNIKSCYAQIAIGMLVLEDIVAIILLVVLTGIATTGKFCWISILKNTILIGIFIITFFLFGNFFVRKLLKIIKDVNSSELLTLFTMGLVLGVGIISEIFNFSIALGSFLAGSILSQSILAKEIKETTEPLRDIFSAIFFITVGILIDPFSLIKNFKTIVFISFLVILGKVITTTIGLFLTGEDFKKGFQAAMCKSQLGEFSFIIASLGKELGVTHKNLSTISSGISIVTIVLSPILNNYSPRIFKFIALKTPNSIKNLEIIYKNFIKIVNQKLNKIEFFEIIKSPVKKIIIYFILFNGMTGFIWLITPIFNCFVLKNCDLFLKLFIWIITIFIYLPFLFPVFNNLGIMLELISKSVLSSKESKQFLSGHIKTVFQNFLFCCFLIIIGGIYLSAASTYFSRGETLLIFIIFLIGLSLFFLKTIIKINTKFENLFIKNSDRNQKKQKN
jgi:CPA2 family monovalent cation:H+ antiporter-2